MHLMQEHDLDAEWLPALSKSLDTTHANHA